MIRFAAIAALLVLPAAASATVYTFDTVDVGVGHDAYAPGFTTYNSGSAAPATVAGVSFAGTSGVDHGAFGFPSNGTQSAFLQTYPGLTDGSFTLSAPLVAGQSYKVSFDAALRNSSFSFIVSQGATVLGTFTPGATLARQGFTFVSTGTQGLTFAAVNGGGADLSAAIDNVAVAVPEPATWAMFVGGFGLVGFAARRRRSNVVAA